ncbi:PDZ domain-containing protein [Scytonema tolypothrichoides VB-61278]|nr:PDZ domain-containing protein [Scytonema tolypothrichoides VB-61278]
MKFRRRDFEHNSEQGNQIVPFDPSANNNQTQKRFSWQKSVTHLSLVLLGSGVTLSGGYLLAGNPLSPQQPNSQEVAVSNNKTAQSNLPPTTNNNFVTTVVDKIGPAVVRIDASRTVTSRVPEVFNDPFFRDFFGLGSMQPRRRTERGTGSGFIVSSDGRILTNAHVVDGAQTVRVRLKDGRSFEGKVLGTDPVTDVAVIQIQASGLPTVRLGNSDQLTPGEWAIAIGNPLGLDNSVTTGIISATGRSSSAVGVPDQRVKFIQTDAAINPGNSGGPLLNQQGEVIGMNTAIIQGAQGLGFAIPINTAQRIANQLVANGKIEHSFVGIQMVDVTPELKQEINSDPNRLMKVDAANGVLVVRVVPNSPAAKAGLRAGDVIQKLNGKSVTEAQTIQQTVENSSVGENLRLQLRRQGTNIDLSVRTGAIPVQIQ